MQEDAFQAQRALDDQQLAREWEPFTDEQLDDLRARLKRVDAELRETIKTGREERGWSQARLADELGQLGLRLDPTAITRIEGGKRTVRPDELWAIAVVFRDEIGSVLMSGTQVLSAAERLQWELRRLEILERRARDQAEELAAQRDLVNRLTRESNRERS